MSPRAERVPDREDPPASASAAPCVTATAHSSFPPLGLILILLAIAACRAWYITHCPFDLSSDEAQYWEWSRRLDLSYYSKGPLVAYIIAASTHLFGNTVFGVRFPAVVLSALTSLVLFALATEMAESCDPPLAGRARVAGWSAALFVQVIPLFAVFGFAMTTDPPLILCWSVALWLFWRMARAWNATGRVSLEAAAALGAAIGLGLLAKYTMASSTCAPCSTTSPARIAGACRGAHSLRSSQSAPWLQVQSRFGIGSTDG